MFSFAFAAITCARRSAARAVSLARGAAIKSPTPTMCALLRHGHLDICRKSSRAMTMKLQGVPNVAPSMNNVFSLARNEAALAWAAAAAGSSAPPVAARE
jgi:hypothetical protein